MMTGRLYFPASLLGDGRVLVAGGFAQQGGGVLQTAEIYTPPATGSGGGGAGPGAGGAGPSGSGGAQGSGGHAHGAGGGANACTPGQQVECACPGGTKGVQDCKADGSGFNACQCEGSHSGGGGAGPGSSGGCGCRFSDDETRAGWPLLVALAALFARRRRRDA
jgi:MYXO-CTERM domain-containing protein